MQELNTKSVKLRKTIISTARASRKPQRLLANILGAKSHSHTLRLESNPFVTPEGSNIASEAPLIAYLCLGVKISCIQPILLLDKEVTLPASYREDFLRAWVKDQSRTSIKQAPR